MPSVEHAYAKLNLALDILGKRADGYHNLRMVMQSIDLADKLTIKAHPGPDISVASDLSYLPKGDGNIAAKAAYRFFSETCLPAPGLHIDIKKHIPVCAGMAGGSSDGAAVLRFLRRTYTPEMPDAALEKIGAMVGSDVPYCVRGGTALAEGRGEQLTTLPPLPPCWFVVCKPVCSISTPELFSQVKVKKLHCHPDISGMVCALEQGDLEGIARRLYNVFEDVLPRKYHQVFEIKSLLLELGAMATSMTGSGPSVFGLFHDQDQAAMAAAVMKRHYASVFVCKPV